MKNLSLGTFAFLLTAAAAFAQYNPFVYQTAEFPTLATFPTADEIGQATAEVSAIGNTLFGPQTVTVLAAGGNTITLAAFQSAVAAAHASGLGGVIDLDNPTFSGTFQEPDPDIGATTTGDFAKNLVANFNGKFITITEGPNNYTEGQGVPYRGRETGLSSGPGFQFSDFQGPQPDPAEHRFFKIVNGTIREATAYDLDFDPDDKIVTIGFNYGNWNEFQSFQQVTSITPLNVLPNIRVTATFSDGSIQEAVAFTSQSNNTIFFGFEAPEGAYLDRLEYFAVGNTWRIFSRIQDLGFIVEGEVSLAPSIGISLTPEGNIEISFEGTLEESDDGTNFSPLNPQPTSPYVIAPTEARKFFRSTN